MEYICKLIISITILLIIFLKEIKTSKQSGEEMQYSPVTTCRGYFHSDMHVATLTVRSKLECLTHCSKLEFDCFFLGYIQNTCHVFSDKCTGGYWNSSKYDDDTTRYWIKDCEIAGEFEEQSNSYWGFTPTQWPQLHVKATAELATVRKYVLKLAFKTLQEEGIIMFAGNSSENVHEFLAIYMKDGHVIHSFNNDHITINMTSTQKYNDGEWHQMNATKNKADIGLCVDDWCDTQLNDMAVFGHKTHLFPKYMIGGLDSTQLTEAQTKLGVSAGFTGHISNIIVKGLRSIEIAEEFNVRKYMKCD